MKKNKNNSLKARKGHIKSLPQFLIDSEIKWLVFIGKGMQYFGIRAVIAFFLGGIAIYTYALFKPLPLIKSIPKQKKIQLHGKVITLDNKPFEEEFQIGVLLGSPLGPFGLGDGSFKIDVPYYETYNIIVWDLDYQMFKLYNLATKQVDGEYHLEAALPYPTDLGRVEGTVKNQDQRPIEGYVEVNGKIIRIENDGSFKLINIPLGKYKIRVLENVDGPALFEEYINVELTSHTPKDITIITNR